MQSNSSLQIMDVLIAKQPTFRIFSQNFQFSNRTIVHEHKVQVQFLQERNKQFQIRNFYCIEAESKLTKVTQIQFQNRIIKIKDYLTSTNKIEVDEPRGQINMQKVNKSRRCQLLTKKFTRQIGQDRSHLNRDTKNVVKNIIHLFQLWINEKLRSVETVKGKIEQLISKGRFNNKMIIDISKDNAIRKAFMQFVEQQGEEAINQSKIRDKQSALEAMQRYYNVCSQENEREEGGGQVLQLSSSNPYNYQIQQEIVE